MCQPSWRRALIAEQRRRELVLLRRVWDRINREYAQELDVEALGRSVPLSAGDLDHQFRQAFGESPYGYLVTRRVERASAGMLGSRLF